MLKNIVKIALKPAFSGVERAVYRKFSPLTTRKKRLKHTSGHSMPCLIAALFGCSALLSFESNAQTPALDVNIVYIEQKIEHPPVLSNLVAWPDDEGVMGAMLGINDNNTTGRFLGQKYNLETLIFEVDEPKASRDEKIQGVLAEGSKLVVVNLPTEDLLSIVSLEESKDDLFFNAQSSDKNLRNEECRANLLHTIPSRAMHGDALMQFFTKKRWKQLFLIEGNGASDSALAEAMRQSIKKFNLKIVEDKRWIENADMRRNASNEVPVFTQAKKYDAVVVTDEDRDFAQYIQYNTWLPRPVTGSAGLMPVTWSPVIEQWGAAQLQSRFVKLAERSMTGRDYSNWAAIRAIGEAVTRTGATDANTIRSYLMSDDFELAGFKGTSLSFRSWNGQMRQPIQLVHDRAVVATAPIEGFLHPITELDTLGYDKAESRCKSFDNNNQ